MNIKEELLKEHSKVQTVRVAEYIEADEEKFSELMNLFFSNEVLVSQRAAWVVRHSFEAFPFLIDPYLEKLVLNLKNDVHDAIIRNTLNVFERTKCPDNVVGELADHCFNYLNSAQCPTAIRAASMTILFKVCQEIPELKQELQFIIEEHLPYGSAGFINRGKKILEKLKKL